MLISMCRLFIFFVVGVIPIGIFCQCPTLDAGPDQTKCSIPGTFQLNGSVSGTRIFTAWTPTIGLSNPNSLSTSAIVSSSTTYTLCVKTVDFTNNLVLNGDFSAGNTLFTSDYTYKPSPSIPGNQLLEGQYTVGSSTAPMHVNWLNCGDHTSGNGNMLVINGATTSGLNAWCQTVSVMPNTEYIFSAWVSSIDPNGPSLIQFNINGGAIGSGNVAISTPCVWVNFYETWNSGSNTSATICIEDLNLSVGGNDFAIDDIVFAPVCLLKDSVRVTPVSVLAESNNNGPICSNETLELNAMTGDIYQWSGPNNFSSNLQSITLTNATTSMSGSYIVTVTGEAGCTATSTTVVSVLPAIVNTLNLFTCDPNQVNSSSVTYSSINGCDSTIVINTLFAPSHNITIQKYTCIQSESSVITRNLLNRYGCDSTITVITTFVPSTQVNVLLTTCDSTLAGVFIKNLKGSLGCDSTVTTTILYKSISIHSVLSYTCDINQVGISTQNLKNIYGCDSTVTTKVSLLPKNETNLQKTTCEPSEVGEYVQNLLNVFGCDSTVTTKVSLLPKNETNLQKTTCEPSEVGEYVQNLLNVFGCDSTVTTKVILSKPFDLSLIVSDLLCFDNKKGTIEVKVNGTTNPYNYTINKTTENSIGIFDNLSSGIYEIIVTDSNGCTRSDIVILNNKYPINVDLGDNINIVLGSGATLNALIEVKMDSISSINWESTDTTYSGCKNCTTQTVYPLVTTSYSITVVNSSGCSDTDLVTVIVDKSKYIYVPNIFSPNGDQNNDIFMIFGKEGQVKNIKNFMGFDRWGNKLWSFNDFLPNNPEYGWDGEFKLQKVNPGVFIWLAEVEFTDGEKLMLNGSITLIR